VRGTEQEVALVAILDLEELGAELFPAAGLLPELGGDDVRQVALERAGAVHLLAHDLLGLAQRDEAERQPAVDAGAQLLDHPGAEHQLLADDIRLGGGFLLRDEVELRGAHRPGLCGCKALILPRF
jgi:hypothetical protein